MSTRPPGTDRVRVQVVLPCLDEVTGLAWVLDRLPAEIAGYPVSAVVADNGSSDGSVELARERGALVVPVTRRGYGSACHAGLEAATAEVVAVMDADASLDPRQLPRVLDPLLADEADLVVGARRPERGAWPWHLRVANAEVARRVRRRCGTRLADVGPMRAAWREPLLALGLVDRRSGYPVETVVAAAEAGWRVHGVPVDYYRRSGRSKVTGTPLGVLRAVHDMSAVLADRR